MELPLSNTTFWDKEMSTLDSQQHASFIIVRVFQHGLIADIKCVLKNYTSREIIDAFKQTRGVDAKSLALAAIALGVTESALK